MNEDFTFKIMDKAKEIFEDGDHSNQRSFVKMIGDILDDEGLKDVIPALLNAAYQTGYEDGLLGRGPYGMKGLTLKDLDGFL